MEAVQKVADCGVSCPSLSDGNKLTGFDQGRLWAILNENPSISSRQALKMPAETDNAFKNVSIRHINRLRCSWGLNRAKGRPRGKRVVEKAESNKA